MITRGPDSDFPSSPPLRLLRVIYSPCDDARPNAAGIFERRQFENVERGGGEVKNDRVGRGWMKFHFDVINSAYGAFAKKIFGIFSIRNRGRPLFLLPPPSPPSCFGSRGLKELFIFLLRRENNSAGELGCSFSPHPEGERVPVTSQNSILEFPWANIGRAGYYQPLKVIDQISIYRLSLLSEHEIQLGWNRWISSSRSEIFPNFPSDWT